ncbi:hypothetical protein [Enterobacter cloacae complex sp. 363J6]|uniref:hypothetical protein n=1 Tax=Enterobacter cloacae complex sp. 363J6 TaxID=3395868 RepID=UPI003CE9BAF2
MVEINGIGVNAQAGSGTQWVKRETQDDPRCGRSPTLAERARKLVDEINAKMVEASRKDISEYVLKYPTKQAYTFDMKRFIGKTMDQECTEKAYADLGEWLAEEGFTFDTQRNLQAARIATSFNSRRVHTNFSDPKRDGYSDLTYYITW